MLSLSILIASAAALAAFVAFRLWEHRRGAHLFEVRRKRLDHLTTYMQQRMLSEVPRRVRYMVAETAHDVIDQGARAGVGAARFVERRFLRLIDMVRGRRATIRREQPSSSFLTDIKEHKRVLRNDRDNSQ